MAITDHEDIKSHFLSGGAFFRLYPYVILQWAAGCDNTRPFQQWMVFLDSFHETGSRSIKSSTQMIEIHRGKQLFMGLVTKSQQYAESMGKGMTMFP